jgi:two-component system response regulator RegX3
VGPREVRTSLGAGKALSGRGRARLSVCHDGRVRILIVEDEDAIAQPLADGLRREGFEVDRVATESAALEAREPDLVLLDLRLPDIDGLDVCRELRARSDVPIIVVTAKSEEVDRVVGLEVGADDYVVKPFGLRELIARIRAVSRRARPRPDGEQEEPLEIGALQIDNRAHRATLDGDELPLTAKEFALLELLARDPGAVISRERILAEVWNTTWYGSAKTIDVHVASLRRKLGDPGWIETVRGVGLRLRTDS